MKYQVISPDGFPINVDGAIYPSIERAYIAIRKWIRNYEAQGFYSQTCYNGYVRRIPVEQLVDYCDIRPVDED